MSSAPIVHWAVNYIAQGFEVNNLGAVPQKHPLTLIREAYGLK